MNRQTKLALAVAGPTAFVGWLGYQYVTEIAAPPVEPPPVVDTPPVVDIPPVVVPVDPMQARIAALLAQAAEWEVAMTTMTRTMDQFYRAVDRFEADGLTVEYDTSPSVSVRRIVRYDTAPVVVYER